MSVLLLLLLLLLLQSQWQSHGLGSRRRWKRERERGASVGARLLPVLGCKMHVERRDGYEHLPQTKKLK
jgi:hypothetical protein